MSIERDGIAPAVSEQPTPEELVARVVADPPRVHEGAEFRDPPSGVLWSDLGCYRFLVRSVVPGMRTIETGLGLSTILFALRGARHTCVFPFEIEAERLRRHCEQRAIPLDAVELRVGWSDEVLPALGPEEFDFVLVDGGHGYPTPAIDWFYAGSRLKQGGILLLDDAHIWAVAELVEFLDRDPRWETVERTRKWAAFRRLSSGTLREDFDPQTFLPMRKPYGPAVAAKIAVAKGLARVSPSLAERARRAWRRLWRRA